jgi:hypothetical protein
MKYRSMGGACNSRSIRLLNQGVGPKLGVESRAWWSWDSQRKTDSFGVIVDFGGRSEAARRARPDSPNFRKAATERELFVC